MSLSTLQSIFTDVADSEIPKKELVVKVVRQISPLEFEIADESGSYELKFLEQAKKRAQNLELSKVIKLYGVQRFSTTQLSFCKNSFWIEEKNKMLNVEGGSPSLKLTDLCSLKPGDVVRDNITVKLFDVKEATKTSKGTPLQKIIIADEDFTISATLWRDDVAKYKDKLIVGSVYEINNVSIDKYPPDTNGTRPKDINIRPTTNIKELQEGDIPDVLKNLAIPVEISGVKGIIKYIVDVHSYLACPGNGGKCGKSVRDNRSCDKCGINFSSVDPTSSYKCDLVFFGEDNVIYHLTAFSSLMKEFEQEGENVEDKLENIKSKPVSAMFREKDDGYVLIKLVIRD